MNRRRRIIELRCMGFTIPQIVEKLNSEGIATCEKTVFRDLHSSTTEEYVEELKRKQFADITLSDDYNVRLKYRDLMLEKLMPREQKISGQMSVLNTNIGFEADPDLKRALMEEAERQRKEHDEQQKPES